MTYNDIRKPEDMVEYMIDCTLATVETMLGKKSTPKHGEFERQCSIAQKGIDFLGRDFNFTGRAKVFAGKMTAFEYYAMRHKEVLG